MAFGVYGKEESEFGVSCEVQVRAKMVGNWRVDIVVT